MDAWHFVAALASALLHAGWNAAVKASSTPREAMGAQMSAAALICMPLMAWTGLPPAAAWPWIAATVTLGVATLLALLQAYASGGFGTVYPMARAVSVCAVAALVPWVVGERLGLIALAGIALIALALGVLAWDTRRADRRGSGDDKVASSFPARALAWTLLAGVTSAAYVLADARGVRASATVGATRLDAALSYGATVSMLNALAMGWLVRGAGAPWTLLRRHARLAWPAALASSASYLLILWVFAHAPVALAAALRDTSAVFAMLIAVTWLHEPLPARRLAALLLALAALPLLRLGG